MENNENNFSEIYLDIEKCENEGLIIVKYDIDLNFKNVEDLISLLNKAINGFYEEKNDISIKNNENMSESEDNESYKAKLEYKKNILARKVVVKNMIIEKEYTQKYFINYIKKKLHDIAEKLLIEKITKYFYSIITRNYLKNININNDDDTYYYSIYFLNINTFCCISIDKNKKIKNRNIFKSFFIDYKENELDLDKKNAEIDILEKELIRHRPRCIILGINNVGAYQLMKFLKDNYSDILIYSDYFSLLKKPKNYENIFYDDELYSIALDQFKFTISPLDYFIDNYNFKYEKNLILNLKLDILQEQINDIPLLNYCLETQIRRLANLNKFKYPKDKNAPNNYFYFINGLGPVIGKIIEESKNIKTIDDIKQLLKKNIYKNFIQFLNNENDMDIDIENDNNNLNNHNFIFNLSNEQIFNKIINTYYPLKMNSIHNVIVNNIDINNNIVNCVLFFNENILNCKLPFDKIPNYIDNKEIFFKKYRILLCKIIEIKFAENEYEIIISNKLEDLEYYNKLSDEESYLKIHITGFDINQEEDYKIKEIEKLKNIINTHKNKNNYILTRIEENNYLRLNNISLDEIKKEKISFEDYSRFYIRPSFMGPDHLILTFSIIENLTLNYDIIIDKNKKYIIKDKEYKSIEEVISNFANKLLKIINDFKTNKYFKSPSQMKSIYNSIFNNINRKTNYYKKINFIDDIIICFMDDSPNYGILLTKTKNNNYIFDYIEIIHNGFNFHNIFFENISLIIDFYNENYEKEYYKEFICNQIIYNIHSQIEDIDIYYDKFEDNIIDNKLNLDNIQNEENEEKNVFLGKKLKNKEFELNDNQNNNNNFGDNDFSYWESNTNNNIEKNKDSNNDLNGWDNSKNNNNNNNKDNDWGINNYNNNKPNNNKNNEWEINNYKNNKQNNNNNNNNNNNDLNWNDSNITKKGKDNFDSWQSNNNINNNLDSQNNNKDQLDWNSNKISNNNNSNNNNDNLYWGDNNNNNNNNDKNKFDSWGDFGDITNDNNNKNNYLNKNENDININREKINNNIPKNKKEENIWNISNNDNFINNNSKVNKYSKFVENYKKNNKNNNYNKNYNNNNNIWNKNKKNNYDNNNNTETKFSGWGSGEKKNDNEINIENNEDENENNNNDNNEYIWSDNKNDWNDIQKKDNDNSWLDPNNNDTKNNNNNNNSNNEGIFNCSDNKFYEKSINNNNVNNNKYNNNINNIKYNNNYNNYRKNNISNNDRNNNGFRNNNYNYSNRGGNNNYNNNFKSKKNKFAWSNVLKNNEGKEDIKDDEEGQLLQFENLDAFGGYNVEDKDNNNENEKQNNNAENNNNQNNNGNNNDDGW